MAQDFFSNVAKDPAAQARPSMSRHNYQVGANFFTCFNDFIGRIEARCYNTGYVEALFFQFFLK